MADWSNLPKDLIIKIVEHAELVYEDYETFRFVCSSWRSTAKQSKFRGSATVPWLMLPEDNASSRRRRVYSLHKHMFRHIDLPLSRWNCSNDMKLLSSCGWLLSISNQGKNISLFNPLSGDMIKLPEVMFHGSRYSYPTKILEKIILSTNPSTTTNLKIAMILQEPDQRCWKNFIVFWSNNAENQWVPLSEGQSNTGTSPWDLLQTCHDICFYQGHFYGADSNRNVLRFDQTSQKIPRVFIVLNLAQKGYIQSRNGTDQYIMYYMVESAGELLHVRRVKTRGDEYYSTTSFEILELNLDDGTAKKVHDLGTRAIFVGSNSSFSVNAYGYEYKPNCIYYTDEARSFNYELGSLQSRGKDIGVYNLSNGEIECFHESTTPHYNKLAPLMWLESPIP